MRIGFPEFMVFLGVILLLLFVLLYTWLVILALRRFGSNKWPLVVLIFLFGWLLRAGGLALSEIVAVLGLCVLSFLFVMWRLGRFGG